MHFSPLGDHAVTITLGDTIDEATHRRVRAVSAMLDVRGLAGVVDQVPGYASISVHYDPARIDGDPAESPYTRLVGTLMRELATLTDDIVPDARTVEIPVCYGGEFGPDLEDVARQHAITTDDVVRIHTAGNYLVYMVGFMPGFAYLGGLSPELTTPRRSSPRTAVPAGAVGIGGQQTGVYPLVSPGGWNLIGRTPLRIFDVAREEPSLLVTGDRVRFSGHLDNGVLRLASVAVSLRIVTGGLQTTVQDLGRLGEQRTGIPVCGAMDRLALRIGNMLVGNDDSAAALEASLIGPAITFEKPALIALTGGDLGATINGTDAPAWHTISVPAGSTLRFGQPRVGCRTYIAVAGGIDVPLVFGSRSTYLRAQFGGYDGRALRSGDVVLVGASSQNSARIASALRESGAAAVTARWSVSGSVRPQYTDDPVVRLIAGAHFDMLDDESRDRLGAATFRISSSSDRMGYRLTGIVLSLREQVELLSEGVAFGTVQLPPGGEPIVLMADHQTTGGYPRVGEVASVDLPLIAQLKPGDRLRFRLVSLDEAQHLYLAQEAELALARFAIALKHSRETT